jgi:hypothetical protein
MSIDRIGKGGGAGGIPPTPEGASGKSSVDKTEKTFSVEKPEAAQKAHHAQGAQGAQGAQAVDATQGASPLARLRAGEIDVNAYVDLKIEDATKGIRGLPPAELAEIKKILRDQIATDPSLVDLVKQSTGSVPDVPED